MRLYDAYKRGFITQAQYEYLLLHGKVPASNYTVSEVLNTTVLAPNYSTGFTTDSYVTILSKDVSGVHKQSITLHNIGTRYSLQYEIYFYNNGIIFNTLSGIVQPSDTFLSITCDPCDSICVTAKSSVPGSFTEYEAGLSVN
jgi:hypothetical protein